MIFQRKLWKRKRKFFQVKAPSGFGRSFAVLGGVRGGFSGLGLQVVSVAVSPFGICGGGYADEAEFVVEVMSLGSLRATEELEIEEVSHSSGRNQLSKNRFRKTLSSVLFESDDVPYSGSLDKP